MERKINYLDKGKNIVKKGARLLAVAGIAATPLIDSLYPSSAAAAEPNVSINRQKIVYSQEQNNELDSVIKIAKFYGDSGPRLTDTVVTPEGLEFVVFRNLVLQKDPNGNIVPLNILDELHLKGYDPLLESGALGIIIPEHRELKSPFKDTNLTRDFHYLVLDTPDLIQEAIKKDIAMGFDPGMITSFGEVVSSKLQIWRAQRVAYVLENGQVKKAPIGEAILQTSLVPEDFILEAPTDDPHITLSRYELLQRSYVLGGIEGLLREASKYMGGDYARLYRVVMCESRLDPNAKNPNSSARGLTQQLDTHAPKYKAHGFDYYQHWNDPVVNILVAIDIWQGSGWGAWMCK